MTGRMKRLLADRARALIAETCGDMPEAAKIRACGVHVRQGLEHVAVERHPNGYAYASGLQSCGSVWAVGLVRETVLMPNLRCRCIPARPSGTLRLCGVWSAWSTKL